MQYDAKCSTVHSRELGRDKGLVKRFRLGREDRAIMDLDRSEKRISLGMFQDFVQHPEIEMNGS